MVAYVAMAGAASAAPSPTAPAVREITLAACGFPLSSGVHAKWLETGGPEGMAGCATADEEEAPRSPFGTTGRVGTFAEGVIVWHRNGGLAGQAFFVPACLGLAYQKLGGPGSWLGFPVVDYHDTSGYLTAEFEGGTLFWNDDGLVECDVRLERRP
jgi:uncharacterized protein with LGFP repeats